MKKIENKLHDVVFEIGVEELPSPYFDCIYSQKEKVETYFKSFDIAYEALSIFITPRRIVFYLTRVQPLTARKEELIKGPSKDKAYDATGNPTKALEGFMRSKDASVSDLINIQDGKRECVGIKRMSGGKKVESILPEVFATLLSLFTFPRTMSWNASRFRFPRPIRWSLCLYGDKKIPVECAGLKASNVTYGHRYISPGKIVCTDVKDYFLHIKKNKIILSEDERIALIREQLSTKADELALNGKNFNEELVHMLARLSEQPFALLGNFRKEYLELPSDVLATCMKHHQKIFACFNTKGKLTNQFIAFLDGKRKQLNRIQEGYENVLESRLRDAAFFIKEDRKVDFKTRYESLKDIVFLGALGTLHDKCERMQKLARVLANDAFFLGSEKLSHEESAYVVQSAHLCKIDLMTQLVYEFPELQGVAGREYLKAEGYPPQVYQSVSDHYLPKSLNEDIKKYKDSSVGRVAALLGIVDRFDTIVGAFATGIELSGSEDPYALRRASGSIVKLAQSFQITFSLKALLSLAYQLLKESSFRDHIVVPFNVLEERILTLFKERIIYALQEVPSSVERMILDSVLASSCDDIGDVLIRFDALKKMYKSKDENMVFRQAVKAIERSGNIVKSAKEDLSGDVDSALFQDPLEHTVYALYTAKHDELRSLIASRLYREALRLYADTFFDTLHQFFEKVMINVENKDVRINRLRLMRSINTIITDKVADLRLIHGINVE
jgi:glycyl-tRNA synthetase beta chain